MRGQDPHHFADSKLCVLSISLDISGFFKESAAYVVKAAKGDGLQLLVYIYILCSFLTYFSINSIVIISLTPLIIHIGDCSTIQDVVPLLITQFIAANTAAMGLLVGSPTNIILGDALHLSFARYWVMMLLPTFVAVVVTLLMLLMLFVWCPIRGHVMVQNFEMKVEGEVNGGETNEKMMVAVELVEVEKGTTRIDDAHEKESAHALMVESNTLEESQTAAAAAQAPPASPLPFFSLFSSSHQPNSLMTHPLTRRAKVVVFALVLLLLSLSNFLRLELWAVSALSALIMLVIDLYICHYKKGLLSFLGQVYARVPWAIGPFVLCMYILVRVLTDVGFTGRFAEVMIDVAGPNVWTQSLVFGFVSAGLVNVLNDLPSSVLWADMLPALCTHYSPRSFQVVLHALLVGVNPGCYLTYIGKDRGDMREGM